MLLTAGLSFRVLGPLQIESAGRTIEVGSPKNRILLAMLLVYAGRQVETARLVDAAWADDLPLNPRRAVQLYMARLRPLAGGALGALIETCSDGYQMNIPHGNLDLARFHAGLEEADRALGRNDLEAESAALASALTEWRGEPLAGVPSDLIHREVVPFLRELRTLAIERRIDVDMRLGRHTELLSELFSLTASHPVRERLWAQLIKALHASGRRADALDVFHAVRRQLADELGIEPGDELRAAHAEVLTGNAGHPPVPRQLPSSVYGFTGRRRELATLTALLEGSRSCVVTGTPGVGKTTLAAHWARSVADRFGDGQLWMDLHGYDALGPLPPEHALFRMLEALGVQGKQIPPDLAGRSALYQSLMDGRRMLMVLDNARDLEQVRPLLPGGPGCFVLVTSRSRMTGLVAATGAQPMALELFTREEAREIMVRRLGAGRIRAEGQAVDRLIAASARLPLALAVVTARAATSPDLPLATLVAKMRPLAGGGLDLLAEDIDVRSVFSWSYDALSPDAARLFRILAIHPGPDIAAPAVDSALGLSPGQTQGMLDELCAASLLSESPSRRYSFHDLLRAYALELALRHDTDAQRREAMSRILHHYRGSAAAAATMLNPRRDHTPLPPAPRGVMVQEHASHQEAMAWLTAELPVLFGLIELDPHSWHLAWALREFLDRAGRWPELAAVSRVGLAAAERKGDVPGQALAHRGIGQAETSVGHVDDARAHYSRALELAGQLNDRMSLARIHRNIARAWGQQGRHTEALHHARHALGLYQALEHRTGEANSLNAIGWYLAQLGAYRAALTECERALALQCELGDRASQAFTRDSIGYIRYRLGDYRRAFDDYLHALAIFQELGNRPEEAGTLMRYGDALQAQGNLGEARDAWKASLEIFTELDHPSVDTLRAKLE